MTAFLRPATRTMNQEIRQKVQRMRGLIHLGRERLSRHSPVWALFLARETFRALEETLDELEALEESPADRETADTLPRAG